MEESVQLIPIIVWCFLGLCALAMLYCFYILQRNNRVCAFRQLIIRMNSTYCSKLISEGKEFLGHEIYESLPSYNRMLYRSFKRLRLENWLTQEDIDRLKSAE